MQNYFPGAWFEVVTFQTRGDRDKTTPLFFTEGSDFFTGEIDAALRAGEIEAAVHSAKDIPQKMSPDLCVAALTKSVYPDDCLVSRGNVPLEELPSGSIVGTSSRNRKEALRRFRHDLVLKDIRGNVDERIQQLQHGDFDAIVVAGAALIRLELEHMIAQAIPPEIIKPHPLQGRLAIQVRKQDVQYIEFFKRARYEETE